VATNREIKTDIIKPNSTQTVEINSENIVTESPSIDNGFVLITEDQGGKKTLISSNIPITNITLNNLDASTDPTASNSGNEGYGVGSFWFNQTTSSLFVLVDDSFTPAIQAEFDGQVSGMTEDVLIRAINAGVAGNSVTLNFDGVKTISEAIDDWNDLNPLNEILLISGDGDQIPDNGESITLAGGADAIGAGVWEPIVSEAVIVDTRANINALTRIAGKLYYSTDEDELLVDNGTNLYQASIYRETKANLDSLTRTQGRIVYATDLLQLFFDDGVSLKPIGSGGGGVDVWYKDDFEITAASDFETGNNTAIFSGGTLQGSLINETATPLEGSRSIRYTQIASSLNDWFSILISIADLNKNYARGRDNNWIFFYDYTGNDNDMEIVAWDNTNAVILGRTNLKKGNNRQQLQFFIPTDCTQIKIGFRVLTLNSGAVLKFDLFELNTNPFNFVDIYNATDWIETTFVVDATTTAPTNGTGTTRVLRYRFDGPDCIAQYVLTQTVAGTNGTGDYLYPTPPGVEIDDSIPSYSANIGGNLGRQAAEIPSMIECNGELSDNSTFNDGQIRAYKYSSNQFRISTIAWFDNWFTVRSGNTGLAFGGAQRHQNFTIRFKVKNRTAFAPHLVSNLQPGANWTDLGPMTIGAVTTAPTKGTVTYDKVFLKRNGSNAYLRYSYRQSTSGTGGIGDYLVNLPIINGVQLRFADGVEVTASAITNLDNFVWRGFGTGDFVVDTAANAISCRIVPYNDFQFRVGLRANTGTVGRFGPSLFGLNNSTTNFAFEFEVPIKGWDIENSVTVLSPLIRTAFLEDVKGATVPGGTFTSGSWATRDLISIRGDLSFCSLSANQFTLQPGKYLIESLSAAYKCGLHIAAIRNISDSVFTQIGYTAVSATGDDTVGPAIVQAEIDITSPKTFEIQHRCTATRSTDGRGLAHSITGISNIYTVVKITKLK